MRTSPAGLIYLPDASYREMTEWVMPVPRLIAYNRLVHDLEHDPRWSEIKRFLRGGYWRNFKAKYPETREMHGRMLQISRRIQKVAELAKQSTAHNDSGSVLFAPAPVAEATQELYRAQCNCAWWHGAFGGLYLPHLRNAIYQHLITADNALLAGEYRPKNWVVAEVADLNIDGLPEVCLSNAHLAACFNPHAGALYELDVRSIRQNLLATLSRRPEAYHETIRQHVQGGQQDSGKAKSIHDRVIFKQAGLDQLLHYDAYLRKSLIDHFYEAQVTLADLAACRESELGDFVTGRYEHSLLRNQRDLLLNLAAHRSGERSGSAHHQGHPPAWRHRPA